MGRRKLLPNINNLLLQLHLPHRSNGGEANESKEVPDDSSPKEEAHFHHNNTTTHHHQHHNHHIFTWPSLKRRPSSSSLASNSSEDDHDHEHDNEICHDTETEPATCCGNRRQITSNDVIHHGIHDVIHDVIHDGIHSDSHKSVVSFGNCEVRTYTQVLGDHPCCSEGCPIQLGWSYTREESIKVDDYERVYHTVNSQEEGGDKEDSAAMQKYTVLHELRLTPEERRSILILSKQQEYVNAASSIGSDSQDSNSADCPENDENNGDSNTNCCESLTACNKDQAAATPTTFQNHERELIRECRRLNRCGGWNVNVKASRKRNKRTQEAFFGCPVTTISRIPPEDATASTPANKP